MISYCVLIPAFNEGATIRGVAQQVLQECSSLIIVDDGSSDNTSAEVQDLSLTLLRNASNMGKAASLWRGMQLALEQGMQGIITLDGDGQHRAEDIPKLIALAERHPDSIVIGSRLHDRESIPLARYRANRFANFWIAWASGYPIEDSQSGFRFYPRKLLANLDLHIDRNKSFVFESEVLIEAGWQGIKVLPVNIPAIYGEAMRPSHFQSVRDILRITKMVAGRLFSKGMNLPGLYRVLVGKR